MCELQFHEVSKIDQTSPHLLTPSADGYTEYSPTPRFLESQRELRDLLLTSAQSLAPTRAGSPVYEEEITPGAREEPRNQSVIRRIISSEDRAAWLRNYLDEVAPWVGL